MTAKRPLRVLHAVLDLHEGGLERLVVDLVQGITTPEFDSRVLCFRGRGRLADELPDDRVIVAEADRGLGLWWPRHIAARIAGLQPDVLHIHSGVWLKAARAAHLAGVRGVLFTDHGRPFPDRLWNRIPDFLGSRFTARVVAVSEPLARHLQERVWVPPAQIRVVRNAIRRRPAPPADAVAKARGEARVPVGAPIIGSVGRLDPVKAYDVLVRAVAELRRDWTKGPKPHLVIVGDGPDRQRIEGVIGDLGVSDAVSLIGWRTDVRPYVQMMDVFALSSASEGTSVSLLEAMQLGRPVAVTNVGGNPDVLGDALRGQIVPPFAPSQLAAVLRSTLQDRGTLDALGARSLARFEEAFSEERWLSEYAGLYRDLGRRRA